MVRSTISGVQDPKGPPWVAFALKVRGAFRPEGQMHARTMEQCFDYRITPQGVAISVDDRPLGQVQPDGTLLDASGQPRVALAASRSNSAWAAWLT